jgi:hypothetical protein
MALSLTQEVTAEFNRDSFYVADSSNWDYLIWQFVTTSGTINITSTNDSGAVTGSFDGSSLTATNFQTVSATALNGLASVTSVATASSAMFRTEHVGRYVRFGGTSVSAAKVFIHFHKIS